MLTLSPTSSASVATAAVTAIPSETAKTLRSLRRRCRARDSTRFEKSCHATLEMTSRSGQRNGAKAELLAFNQIVNVDGIASACLADGRSTIAAAQLRQITFLPSW